MWQTRSLFVSSPFRDMQAERDHLNNIVFPELAERLRCHCVHLQFVDLRWGVETASIDRSDATTPDQTGALDEAKQLLILKVCLDEVEICRPLFIALLGDRYGSVLEQARLEQAGREKGIPPERLEGRSVTALEIEYGVLDCDPEEETRSFFYFRNPLPYGCMRAELTAQYLDDQNSADPAIRERAQRLGALKQRIRDTLPGRVREYSAVWNQERECVVGLEEFGRQVLEDLWNELRPQIPALSQPPTEDWASQEAATLEEFIEMAGCDFRGRGDVIEQLQSRTREVEEGIVGQGVCLIGESGSGKSAIFSQLARQAGKTESMIVLVHAAGVSARAASIDTLLQKWIEQLRSHLGLPDLSERPQEAIEYQFAKLLADAARHKRVVILLDALDQLENTPRTRQLTWLPERLPANVRIVATSLPGLIAQNFSHRPGMQAHQLRRLTVEEADDIVRAICRRYHRTLNDSVMKVLLDKFTVVGELAAGSPLWLRLAAEELNLLDADDLDKMPSANKPILPEDVRLVETMQQVAQEMPAEIPELYGYLLKRAEKVSDPGTARAFARMLAASRSGWRMQDLRALLLSGSDQPWSDLRFARLRRSFRGHLVKRGRDDAYDFFHLQARVAVETRYPTTREEGCAMHRSIADYLESLRKDDSMRSAELMHHLLQAGEMERAATLFCSLRDISSLNLVTSEVDGLERVVMRREPGTGLEEAIGVLVPRLIKDLAGDEPDLTLFRQLVELKSSSSEEARNALRLAQNHLLVQLQKQVPVRAYLALLGEVSQQVERLHARNPDDLEAVLDFVQICRKRSQLATERRDLSEKKRVLEAAVTALEPRVRWEMGNAFQCEAQARIALQRAEKALRNREHLLQDTDVEPLNALRVAWYGARRATVFLAQVGIELGGVCISLEDLEGASAHLNQAQRLIEALCENFPLSTEYQMMRASAYSQMAWLAVESGEVIAALDNFARARALCQEILKDQSSHRDALHLLISNSIELAKFATRINPRSLLHEWEEVQPNDGAPIFPAARAVIDELFGYFRFSIGESKVPGAPAALLLEREIMKALNRLRNLHPEDDEIEDLSSQFHNEFGQFYLKLEAPDHALEHANENLSCTEQRLKLVPDSPERVRDLFRSWQTIRMIHDELGDEEASRYAAGQIRTVLERWRLLAANDAEAAVLYSDELGRLGEKQVAAEDWDEAYANFEQAVLIREGLFELHHESKYLYYCGTYYARMARIREGQDRGREAIELRHRDVMVGTRLTELESETPERWRELEEGWLHLLRLLEGTADQCGVEEAQSKILAIGRRLMELLPRDMNILRNHADMLHTIGRHFLKPNGKAGTAVDCFAEELDLRYPLFEMSGRDPAYLVDVAICQEWLADAWRAADPSVNVEGLYRPAVSEWAQLMKVYPREKVLPQYTQCFEKLAEYVQSRDGEKGPEAL